jgi:hypothetical protein
MEETGRQVHAVQFFVRGSIKNQQSRIAEPKEIELAAEYFATHS